MLPWWLGITIICNLISARAFIAAEVERTAAANSSLPLLTNLLQLQDFAHADASRICSFQLTGIVCAVDRTRSTLAFQDLSAAEILHVVSPAVPLERGNKIVLEGTNFAVTATENGLWLGTGPVVNNDGLHPLDEKSGTAYLNQGLNPIRLRWFNHLGQYSLSVDYEGPDLERRRIPDSALFRRTDFARNASETTNGLQYAVYEGVWHYLPDFKTLTPTRTGTVPDFDVSPKTRNEDVGLQFDGFFKVPREGVYTFYLKSDDGSDLFVGESKPVRLEVIGSDGIVEGHSIADDRNLVGEQNSFWAELEGDVTFVGEHGGAAELEVRSKNERVHLILLDSSGLSASRLRKSRIRAKGICRTALTEDGRKMPGVLLTLNATDLQTLGDTTDSATISLEQRELNDSRKNPGARPREVLTTVEDVRRLSREQADRGYLVKVRGVLTCLRPDFHSVVIQDAVRGIYAQGVPPKTLQPELGQYWEIEATTRSGAFAPVLQIQRASCLGLGRLPEPIHPTWDQLMNGSLDTQYVELQGIITESDENKIVLLTRGGKITVGLPDMQPNDRKGYALALVRLRGCLFPSWDPQTHQVRAGEMEIYSAAISAEEPIPVNPFAAPMKSFAELRLFDSQANVFQRAKVSGQIVHGREGNYFFMNGTNGMRFVCKNADLSVGDLVEVAGLPEWGGLSPVLREAVVRKTGHALLPAARLLGQEEVVDASHDSTLVELEALLVNSRKEQGEQVLELQSGLRTFLARVKASNEEKSLLNGSRLHLKGVYAARGGNSPLSVSSFEILLNSSADIAVLAVPSWWTTRRVMGLLEVMALVLLAGSLWVLTLKRRVRTQTNTIRHQIQRHATMEERARLAREFHDTLEQALAGIGLQLNGLADVLRNAPSEALRILGVARSMVRHSQEEAKRSVRNLRTFALEQSNLSTALSQLAVQTRNGWTGNIEVGVSGSALRLPARVETHLLRISQESINNAIKHGVPKNVRLNLTFGADWLQLSVEDDGCGFDVEHASGSPAGHFGLLGMRERAEKIGGVLKIRSVPGAGTKVELSLPITGSAGRAATGSLEAVTSDRRRTGNHSHEERQDTDTDS
jgi:signal transduction histidine kinase